MKKNILILILVYGLFLPAIGQTIFSNGTGGGEWSSGSTWLGGVVPNVNSDVVIAGSDSVVTTVNAICQNLTVLSGGILATGADSISVASTFVLEEDAIFYNSSTKAVVPGIFRELNEASTVVHMGSGTVGGAGNDEFGNLEIRRAEGSTPATNLTIKGNLIITMAGASIVFRGCRPATGSQSHTVEGDIIINSGTLSCVDVGDLEMVGIWNVNGSVYLMSSDARMGCFSSANAAGLGIYNIDGDIINNGGRIQAGTSSSAGSGKGIINLKGNFTMNSGNFATNSIGPFAINFVGYGVQNFLLRGANLNLNTELYDTVKAGSTVVMDLDTCKWGSATGGEFAVEGVLELKESSRLTGSGAFILNPNATLKIGSPDGITSGTTMLGSVHMLGGRNYSADANYIYSGTGAQVFGDGLPATVKGLGINNSAGLTLSNDMTINNSLSLTSGSLNLDGKVITLGANATLSETAGNTVKGNDGKIITTRDIGTPSAVNVGGLGAEITSGSNLGNTTIERYHSARSGGGNFGVLRAYNIQPASNSGLNATLRFHYDESELNGIPEGNLILFKSPDGSDNSWSLIGGTVNTNDNYVEISGVDEFSYWTLSGTNNPLPVESEESNVPTQFSLYQNYPNPFNPSTNIKFDIPEASFVNVSVFNILGEKVAELVNEYMNAGSYKVSFGAERLSAGIYLYKITAGSFNYTRKMTLVK